MVIIKIPRTLGKQRYKIRVFKTNEKGHEFLNKGSNALDWKIINPDDNPHNYPLKSGTYAYAGGEFHNVKGLDTSILSHI